MASSLFIVTPPAVEHLTVEEAKRHLRVLTDDDNDDIAEAITAARQYYEKVHNRALITQTLRMRMDSFPDLPNATLKFFVPTYSVESYLARAISLMSGPIRLFRPPCQSVTSITYLDSTGTLQTLSPSLYIVDTDAEPCRIAPANNQPWPVTLAQQGAVNVTFKAGYGDTPLAVPLTVKQALKLLTAHFYEHREPTAETPVYDLPMSVDALAWADRVYEIP